MILTIIKKGDAEMYPFLIMAGVISSGENIIKELAK